MSVEQWQILGGTLVAIAYGAHSKWEQRRARKDRTTVADRVEEAVELSRPTGNGFAQKVTASLERIEANQKRTERKIDEHITVHANAHVMNHRRGTRDLTEL